MSTSVEDSGHTVLRLESGPLRLATGAERGAAQDTGMVSRSANSGWGSSATLMTVVIVVISLGNYSYSFLVLHLMGAEAFARFSAAQGLLLVIGSGCMAAIPWAMARFIAEHSDRRARREAMHFGLVASTLQGLVFAVVAGSILGITAGPEVGLITAVSAFVCSVIAVPIGFLQGLDRIRAIMAIRVLEFIIRCGAGLLVLLLVSRSASAALIGYPIGAVVLVVVGLAICRSGLPPVGGEQATIRGLARQSLGLGAIQVFLAMLGALDTVAALAAHLGSVQTASYQSVAILGRIPLFMSAAIGLTAYVHVVNAPTDGDVKKTMGEAVRLYSLVAVPFVLACVTVPDSLIHLLIPGRYTDALPLLRFTAISGAAVGWIDVVSTAHQARSAFRSAIAILGVAAVAQPVMLICAGRIGGIWAFAPTLVAVSLIAAVVLTVNARAWLVPHVSLHAAVATAAALTAAILLHTHVAAWIGLIAFLGVVALRALSLESRPKPGSAQPHESLAPTPADDVAGVESVAPEPLARIAPEADQLSGRVVILGDSWIRGLGVKREQSFGEVAAAELGAEEVLNLSGVSKGAREMVEEADRIRAFGPTLAILFVGGTESLVHPGPVVQRAIERWGPDSWKGLTGLEPRPYYPAHSPPGLRQYVSAAVKAAVKRSIVKLTGGRRRTPLSETRESIEELIEILHDIGCLMTFVAMPRIDERLFPGTGKSILATERELKVVLQGRPDAVLVEVREALHYWDDFLKDNLHLSIDGHRRVAGLVVNASRRLQANSTAGGRLPRRERDGSDR